MPASDARISVCAGIVCHNADPARLRRLISSCIDSVDRVLVFDNASRNAAELRQAVATTPHLSWQQSPHNIGLAAAYNQLAKQARRSGASHLLLFDQDSLCEAGMVERLIAVDGQLRSLGISPGLVGPLYLDRKHQRRPQLPQRQTDRLPRAVQAVDFTISSGSLIGLDAYTVVGEFMEPLFIQYIDIEWGFRAWACGRPCFVVEDAVLQHDIGDSLVKLPLLNRRIPRHSAERGYYFCRNLLALCRLRYIPLRWKVREVGRTLAKLMIQPILFGQAASRLGHMLAGLRDGLRRIGGPRRSG
ncbi:glycosyltransferase family 2 protein [Parachitinimonas caeni]|uniref:Glycosyltransferase family 2 protein n=1 Tax=Parachitinimonas caeni TaxID=3031301 RepID=A0ABT7DRU7_9NEIS|nr:glycosyltransferase family 2 protein [Parachitinimonas caeni]MDK2122788.1 glycosyltransferase family 2 protein [Parachitinimonas caeni]